MFYVTTPKSRSDNVIYITQITEILHTDNRQQLTQEKHHKTCLREWSIFKLRRIC